MEELTGNGSQPDRLKHRRGSGARKVADLKKDSRLEKT
jgi:hypothetical protein